MKGLSSYPISAMTEKEKMLCVMIYDANYAPQLTAERIECKEMCRDCNDLRPRDIPSDSEAVGNPCRVVRRIAD